MRAILLLFALAAPASAEGTHAWHVLKANDGVYAYDAGSVANEEGNIKGVWILSEESDGLRETGYFLSCRTNSGELIGSTLVRDSGQEDMLMAEGSAKPADPWWSPLREKGVTRVAVDVACGRPIDGVIHVDNRQAAIDKLKTHSN